MVSNGSGSDRVRQLLTSETPEYDPVGTAPGTDHVRFAEISVASVEPQRKALMQSECAEE